MYYIARAALTTKLQQICKNILYCQPLLKNILKIGLFDDPFSFVEGNDHQNFVVCDYLHI
jgi:hypothetical protein